MPRIQKEEIVKKSMIGKGMFGVVWLGHCRGLDVAVKILHSQDIDDTVLKEFEKEVDFMRYAQTLPETRLCNPSSFS